MTYKELQERSKKRIFDRITIVTDDLFKETANLEKVYKYIPDVVTTEAGTAEVYGNKTEYTQFVVSGWIGDIELRVLQPVDGDTVYSRYLKKFGTGICNLCERISSRESYEREVARYAGKKIKVAQKADNYEILDLLDELGILYTIHFAEGAILSGAKAQKDRKICQINITCPDVVQAAYVLEDILEIGPYEIGICDNRTVSDLGILVDGELLKPDFKYLLGMNLCGNLEIETISPEKGPNCFADFIRKRPKGGYNHLKEVVPLATGKWQEEVKHYEDLGIKQCIKGKIGPCGWCFEDTMESIGFLVELGDGVPMTRLPDGYNAYNIPDENQ